MNTETEILESLKTQVVTKIERMKKQVQGELIETNRYIITFARTKIPNLIKLADWHHEIVQPRCID